MMPSPSHQTFLLILLVRHVMAFPPYMYAAMAPEDHFPVHELLLNETFRVSSTADSPVTANTTDGDVNATQELRLPEFLVSPNGHRVVEFYAPWCPHCRHFKDQFIQFARQVSKLATQAGSHIDVHAISCQVHHPICQHETISGFPWIAIIPDGSVNGTRVKHHDLHPFMVLEMLSIQMDELDVEESSSPMNDTAKSSLRQHTPDTTSTTVEHAIRTKDDIYMDAFLSFDMALRQSVYMKQGPLTIMKRRAFTDWISLLHDTLPPVWKIHHQISAIRNHQDDAIKDEAKLLALIDPHKPTREEWSYGCSKGEEGMGYTCGLWELFHIMTVGVVEWNTMSNEWSIVPTMKAADSLRLYVEHFFGCEVCSHNFMKAYDACWFDRCDRLTRRVGKLADWKELPLWLWETHNAVNVRLMKERAAREGRATTRQDEIDAQWPSRDDCPRCWLGDSWNEEFIFMYLRLVYWPDDDTSEDTRRYLSTTKSLLEEDDDSYYHYHTRDFRPSLLSLLSLGGAAGVVLFVAHARKVQRDISGYHKKFESDVTV